MALTKKRLDKWDAGRRVVVNSVLIHQTRTLRDD